MFGYAEGRHDVGDRDGFILGCEYGTIAMNQECLYYKLTFNTQAFTEDLFEKFNIERPAHITRAVHKRKAEYLAGRLCCQRLLRRLNCQGSVTSHYPDRQPLWPSGIVGSISHTEGTALAVISRKHLGTWGVDIEKLDAQSLNESASVITTEKERTRFNSQADFKSPELALMLAFSAKESLFKALYPRLGFYFGFEYAELERISPDHFTLRLCRDLSSQYKAGTLFRGTYEFDEYSGTVTTIINVK